MLRNPDRCFPDDKLDEFYETTPVSFDRKVAAISLRREALFNAAQRHQKMNSPSKLSDGCEASGGVFTYSRERRPLTMRPKSSPSVDDFKQVHRSKTYNDLLLEDRERWGELLSFNATKVTYSCIQKSLHQTKILRDTLLLHGEDYKTAAILGIMVIQHRVLLIEDGLHNLNRKWNAWNNFPEDVAGQWCQPAGDLLIYPGFSENPLELRKALKYILNCVDIVRRIDGNIWDQEKPKYTVTETAFNKKFDVIAPGISMFEMNHIFKPIFTSQNFTMESTKMRLVLELFQYGFLTFLKLAEWALDIVKNYGAALCFVLHLQKCVAHIYNVVLLNQNLVGSYTFTMTHWLTARCYYEIYRNFEDSSILVSYRTMQEKLRIFDEEFYSFVNNVHSVFQYSLTKEYPSSAEESASRSFLAYNNLDLEDKFYRSIHQKEMVMIQHFKFQFSTWYEQFQERKADMVELFYYIEEIIIDIEDQMRTHQQSMDSSNSEIDDLDSIFHAKLRMLAGTSQKYKILCELCMLLDASPEDSNLVLAVLPDVINYKRRSSHLRMAAWETNRVFVKDYNREPAGAVAQLSHRCLMEEVLHVLDVLDYKMEPSIFSNICDALLQSVVVWFFVKPTINTYFWLIPIAEQPICDSILAMYYYGSSIANFLMYRATNDEILLHNAKYMFALSTAFINKTEVIASIMKAFINHARLTKVTLIDNKNSGIEQMPQKLQRSFAVIRKLLPLLPLLYEQCIHCSIQGPTDYPKVYLLNSSKAVCPAGDYFPKKIKLILNNMKYYVIKTLKIKNDVKFLAQPKNYCSQQYDVDALDLDWQDYDIPTLRNTGKKTTAKMIEDKRPPVKGIDECSYGNCPIEQYFQEDEQSIDSSMADHNRDVYREIISMDRIPYSDQHDMYLLNFLRNDLKSLIELAILDLKGKIKKESGASNDETEDLDEGNENENIYIPIEITICDEELSDAKKTKSQASFLLSELKHLKQDLDTHDNDTPVMHVITKTLFVLDRLIYKQNGYSQLLRGSYHL